MQPRRLDLLVLPVRESMSRSAAYVAKAILDAPNREDFATEMTSRYQEMLHQHLADPSLAKPTGT